MAGPSLPPNVSALIITTSDRSAAGTRDDASGRVLADRLIAEGFLVERLVIADDQPAIEAALVAGTAAHRLVVTTGGTGLTPRDVTPQATKAVLDYEIPGIAEAIRVAGVAQGIPTAMLSRGIAGLAGRTLVVNVPGSTGGVRDALTVLGPVLAHAVSQIAGGDH